MKSKEITTISGAALGSLVGGTLLSPLGPWAAVGGSTVGAGVGGWMSNQIWREFYLDMQEKLAGVKALLEEERYEEAVELIVALRAHPRYQAQEEHFRSELERILGAITRDLALGAEQVGDEARALAFYRQASAIEPRHPHLLWKKITLSQKLGDEAYELRELEPDLRRLLELEPGHERAYSALGERLERRGATLEAESLYEQAARALEGSGESARPFLAAMLRLAPKRSNVRLALARLDLDGRRWQSALDLLDEEVLEGEAGQRAQALRGEALYGLGRAGEARTLLEAHRKTRGFSPAVSYTLASIARDDGRFREAVDLAMPLVASPRWAGKALELLIPCLIRDGALDEAAIHLDREAIRSRESFTDLVASLADALRARNREEDARRWLERIGALERISPFWGRYEIVQRQGRGDCLGAGRMGRVLLGRRKEDRLLVAIREVPLLAADALLRRRFVREVERLESLDHPRVLRLLDHALGESKCLMALEYCSGGSLQARLGGKLLWGEIKGWMLDALEGLAYLHDQDPPLVHRNLKPSNLLLDGEGRLKLADFGMARELTGGTTSVVTSVREQAGLYTYMAPEVILGSAELGAQADVYSLGCILHEALTGAAPFASDDVDAQIKAHFEAKPEAPSRRCSWVPEALDAIVLRCLEKAPDRRWATAKDLAAALRAV